MLIYTKHLTYGPGGVGGKDCSWLLLALPYLRKKEAATEQMHERCFSDHSVVQDTENRSGVKHIKG